MQVSLGLVVMDSLLDVIFYILLLVNYFFCICSIGLIQYCFVGQLKGLINLEKFIIGLRLFK